MHDPAAVPTVPQLLDLARREPALAEAAFNRLPSAAQSTLVAGAPAGERMRLLLLAEDCAPLVRAMPAPVLAQTVAASGDDADLLARYADARQLAAAIDLDCRREGRIRSARFRRWVALLVAASEREACASLRHLDTRLLVVGLRPYVRAGERLAELVRLDRYRGATPYVGLDDLDSDDEDIVAFLRLLEQEAPQLLSELGALLVEEDDDESINEDYAGHEQRMDEIGLKDYGRAAEVYGGATPTQDTDERGLITDDGLEFLRRALAALIARDDCDEALMDRLSRAMAELANDIAIADGAAADEAAAAAARTKADRLVANGLRRLSDGDVDRAADLLTRTSPRDLLRAGL